MDAFRDGQSVNKSSRWSIVDNSGREKIQKCCVDLFLHPDLGMLILFTIKTGEQSDIVVKKSRIFGENKTGTGTNCWQLKILIFLISSE